jgi:hypothetical protein
MNRLPTRLALRAAPLVVAMGLALPAQAVTRSAPATLPAVHAGAVALHDELRALMPATPKAPGATAASWRVTRCADDNGVDTLRGAVAAAGEGDTVDLTHLACSTITLTQGAIPVLLNTLTIAGPGAQRLKIDAHGTDRAFIHPGYGALTMQGLTVRNGAARVSGNHITGGGCIASAGYVVLEHSVVSGCEASAEGVYGGGIFAYGLVMYTSTLSGNMGLGANPSAGTATFGGGAYASVVYLVSSSVSGNRATRDTGTGQSGYETGGGIFANNGGYVGASTIDGNYSHGVGGGLSTFGGYLIVANSTVSGNVARSGSGGGLDVRQFYGGIIANSTITANTAPHGGGAYLRGSGGSFTLYSSILAANKATGGGPDLGSAITVGIGGSHNLVVAAAPSLNLPADTLHANPLLLPLAENGGPTRTHALSAGSPALDAGNNVGGLATDQRGPGYPRVVGSAPDIGAFEGFVVPPIRPVNIPAVSNALLALLAALVAAIGAAARFFTSLSPSNGHSSHR